MHRLIKLWLKLNRATWRGDPCREERRHALVKRLAPGRSFLDVGGMWSLAGGIGFRAEAAGATQVTLLDAVDPSPEFDELHAERDSQLRYVQGDLHEVETLELVGAHDVVWCTGVLYHTPHPYQQIEHLRRLTKEHLVLGTQVIPEIPGFRGSAIFYPLLDDKSREALAAPFSPDEMRLAVSEPFSFNSGWEYSNWWWGITPSALRAMLKLAGFEIVEEHRPEPLFIEILAKAVEGDFKAPPLDYARLRGLARES